MRANQWLINVTVDGEPLGIFDSWDGGDGDSDEVKYRPGGGQSELSLGGSTMVTNITVGRLYLRERDHEMARRLYQRRGKARATVSRQPLDDDGLPYGAPNVWQGVLKTVTYPAIDSTSNAASILSLVVSTDGDMS